MAAARHLTLYLRRPVYYHGDIASPDGPVGEGMGTMTATTAPTGETAELHPIGVVLAGVILVLSEDPEIREIADVNDAERFIEWCASHPQFEQKVTAALLTVREWVTA